MPHMLLGSIQGNMERGPPVGISGVYVGAGRQRASHGVNIVYVSSVNYWRIVFGIRAVVHHLRRSDLPEVLRSPLILKFGLRAGAKTDVNAAARCALCPGVAFTQSRPYLERSAPCSLCVKPLELAARRY